MRPITRQQISEFPPDERRRFKVWANEYLGIQYAAQQRHKRVAKARMEMELDLESEEENESECK